jgi:alpha-glucosidase
MTVDKDWWKGAVVYQIYPRSYYDSNGDGVGDLPGIITKLDYVASLGVDVIWVSPFFKSPMKDFGYDISDYRDVDPIFGSLDDFNHLLKEAHARGLKVMLDQVWSHTSDQHDWFKESRMDKKNAKNDWYIWSDSKPDGTPPNNWLSIFGGPAWTWDTRRQQYYCHHFLSSQPALNLWNPDVRAAILNTARFWFEMGIDGFRLDVINCALSHPELKDNPVRGDNAPPPTDMSSANPMSRQVRENAYGYLSDEVFVWLNQLRSMADEFGSTFLMGEIGGDDNERTAVQYTQKGNRLHSAYSFGLTGKTITKETVLTSVGLIEDNIKDGWMTYALGNHDNTRFASNHGQMEDVRFDYALMGMALLLTMRGSVCMYQGEELGLTTAQIAFEDMQDPYDIRMYPDSMNRDGGRTPMPWVSTLPQAGFSTAPKTWLPVATEHVGMAVDVQEADENSVLNHYRRFLNWRKGSDVLRLGDIEVLESPSELILFKRIHNGKTMLCVFNTVNDKVAWNLPSGEYARIDEISRGTSVEGTKVSFDRYGYALFEQK